MVLYKLLRKTQYVLGIISPITITLVFSMP
jgi:hypothetical protein